MEEFKFEHSHKFTEQEYVDLMSLFAKKTRPFRLTIISVVGIACLFWSYTLIIGIILILIAMLIPILRRALPGTATNNYKKIPVLKAENLYGIDEKELWIKNDKSFLKNVMEIGQSVG